MAKYYVYFLKDGDDVFYVGKGTGNRMYYHYKTALKTNIRLPVLDKIRKMVSENRTIVYEKVFETNDQQEAYIKEKTTIKEIGIDNLKNITQGGEGATYVHLTEQHRKNISKSIKRLYDEGIIVSRGFWDHTEEQRKIDLENLKKFAIVAGSKGNKDTSKKKSMAQKLIWKDPNRQPSEHARMRMAEGGKKHNIRGRVLTEDHKQKIREGVLKYQSLKRLQNNNINNFVKV